MGVLCCPLVGLLSLDSFPTLAAPDASPDIKVGSVIRSCGDFIILLEDVFARPVFSLGDLLLSLVVLPSALLTVLHVLFSSLDPTGVKFPSIGRGVSYFEVHVPGDWGEAVGCGFSSGGVSDFI